MRVLLVISALCVQMWSSYGHPSSGPKGVGAYAYQDSSGQRYGGTYELEDGKVVPTGGDPPPPFVADTFQDLDDFFPDYFKNLENLLQEAFRDQLETQKLAFDTAKKAFEVTSNQAGYIPDFASRLNFGIPGFNPSGFGMPNFPFGAPGSMPGMPLMPNMAGSMGPNSAYAGAAAGPGFSQQQIFVNPGIPNKPNINVMQLSEAAPAGKKPGFYSVSSSSYSSSQNINGKPINVRGGETVVNENGKITSYKLNNK